MEQSAAAAAAELLAQARRDHTTIEGLPDNLQPQDLDEAYQIQDALIPLIEELSNGKRAGYKAGATTEAAQQLFGLDTPFRGILVSSYMLESGAVIAPADCKFRVLEAEFAFRMAEDLPKAAAPYDPGGVAAAVGAVMTSIEVVELFESTFKRLGAQNLEISNVRPYEAAKTKGFRFEFGFLTKDGLAKSGSTYGILKNKRLFMVIYSGANIHYYDKGKEDFEGIVRSLRIL